jgi:16S rRNA (guanine966-N2)-methyltransferase
MTTSISGGLFRGLALSVPKGLSTRPTSAMVREAVMAILGPSLEDASVLDAFAGSGAMGLEALSRGASGALFCDRSQAAVASIRANIGRLPDWARPRARVLRRDLRTRSVTLKPLGPFDLFFLDPPYADPALAANLLAKAADMGLAAPGAVAVWEHDARSSEAVGGLLPASWRLDSLRRWGGTAAAFLELAGSGGGSGRDGPPAGDDHDREDDDGPDDDGGGGGGGCDGGGDGGDNGADNGDDGGG